MRKSNVCKISEIPDNTMLCIGNGYCDDLTVMEKADFLKSDYFLDYPFWQLPEVTLAERQVATFDLKDILEYIGEDDMYEDWVEHVYDSLRDQPETIAFLDLIKRTFDAHPTYYKGKLVEIDMTPK